VGGERWLFAPASVYDSVLARTVAGERRVCCSFRWIGTAYPDVVMLRRLRRT
jgi:hypothetical protein